MPVQASSEYLPDHGPVYSSTSASLLHSPLYHPTKHEAIGVLWKTIVWSYLITSSVTNFKMLNDILSHLYGPSAPQYNSNILCCGKLCGVGWRIANKITTQYCSLLQNMNQTQAQWLLSLPPTWTLSKHCILLTECTCFLLTGFFRTINDFPNDIKRMVFVIRTASSCDWDPYLLNTTESNLALQGVNHVTVCLSVIVLQLFIHQFMSNRPTIGSHTAHILRYNTPLQKCLTILLRPVASILI